MASWGVPDFDARSPAQQEIDRGSDDLRAKLEREGKMTHWPMRTHKVQPGYDAAEIQEYCVRNEKWQKTRLSMKGVPTHEKLAICMRWWETQLEIANKAKEQGLTIDGLERVRHITELQVGNYLAALRRGGQLDDQNRVRKYL